MLDACSTSFTAVTHRKRAGPGHPPAPLHVAACALLLELAHADGEFSDSERQYIHNALSRHFGLDNAALEELLRVAEAARSQAIDHFAFTREITRQYDLGQKMVLVEVMWA